MKENNLKYLSENFLTLEQLASRTKSSVEEIERFIAMEIIPRPSYIVRRTVEISSPLDDAHTIEETILYFPESYVELLKKSRAKNAEEIKKSFIEAMSEHLLAHSAKEFAYGNVFETDGTAKQEKVSQELENEWDYFCQGIYGICTLHATPQEVIEKEIAVKKLLDFLDKNPADELANHQDEIVKIVEEFDKVAQIFAPYQRAASSRGKYVDATLKLIEMEDRVKKYE